MDWTGLVLQLPPSNLDTSLVLHWVQDNIEAFGGEVCSLFILLVWQTCLWRDHTRHLLGTHPTYTDGYISECCYGITQPPLLQGYHCRQWLTWRAASWTVYTLSSQPLAAQPAWALLFPPSNPHSKITTLLICHRAYPLFQQHQRSVNSEPNNTLSIWHSTIWGRDLWSCPHIRRINDIWLFCFAQDEHGQSRKHFQDSVPHGPRKPMAANPTTCPCHVDGLYYVCTMAEIDRAVPIDPRRHVMVDRVSAYG